MKNELLSPHTIINRHNVSNKYSNSWRSHRGRAYEEYREKWHSLPINRDISPFPLHLDLDIISSCNLRCVMCAQTILKSKGTIQHMGSMSLEFVKYLIDQGAGNGLASIKFNFQGEPLLHVDLPAMIEYAKHSGIVDTSINTNATLLTMDKSLELLESGLDNIFFSIDSSEKERYEAIRVGADYDVVMENVQQFLHLKQKLGKHRVQTGVNMVVLEENRGEIRKMEDYWKERVDTFSWGLEQHTSVLEASGKNNRQPIPHFCCSQLWQRMFIVWDGTCVPCCMDSRHELVLGNAHNLTVAEIWQNSPLYKCLRDYHKSGDCLAVPLCKACSFPYVDDTSQIMSSECGS